MKSIYLECSCSSKDHLMVVSFDSEDPKDRIVYVEQQLVKHIRLYKRIWIALKYLFKRNLCNFGYWTCTILTRQQAGELQNLLAEYLKTEDS